jgi:large subunit ribosomal protein L4
MGGVMKVEVKNWDNEVVGSIDLPDEVFAREVNQHLVWEVVRAYLASRRRGTHKAKNRGEVKGTRAKPWKQKHTGRARAGSRQSPLWRKGGVAHGPRPRSYVQKVNKKARKAALRGVLSQRLAEGRLIVLGSLELEAPKTKDFLKRLDSLGVSGEKVLLVDGLENLNLHLASRNRPDVKMLDAGSLNAYEVLNHRWIVASEPSVRSLAEVLS